MCPLNLRTLRICGLCYDVLCNLQICNLQDHITQSQNNRICGVKKSRGADFRDLLNLKKSKYGEFQKLIYSFGNFLMLVIINIYL